MIEKPHSLLFNNGGAGMLATLPDHRHCYFDADTLDGVNALRGFLELWNNHTDSAGPDRGRSPPADRGLACE